MDDRQTFVLAEHLELAGFVVMKRPLAQAPVAPHLYKGIPLKE